MAKRISQSVVEYIMLVSVVAAALVAMSVYVQRGTQANLKLLEDQINMEMENEEVAGVRPAGSSGDGDEELPGYDGGGNNISDTVGNPGSNSGRGDLYASIYDEGQNGAYITNSSSSSNSSVKGFKDLYNPNTLGISSEGTLRLHFEISTLNNPDRRNVVRNIPDSFKIFIPPGATRVMIDPECFANQYVAMGYHYKAPLENTSFYSMSEIPDPYSLYRDRPGDRLLDRAQSRDLYDTNSQMSVGGIDVGYHPNPMTVEDSGWLYTQVLNFDGASGLKDLWIDIDLDRDAYTTWYNNVGRAGSEYVWDTNGNPVKR